MNPLWYLAGAIVLTRPGMPFANLLGPVAHPAAPGGVDHGLFPQPAPVAGSQFPPGTTVTPGGVPIPPTFVAPVNLNLTALQQNLGFGSFRPVQVGATGSAYDWCGQNPGMC